MRYTVSIEGDINDADYTTETNTVDLDAKIFSDWIEPYKDISNKTFRDLFEAFGKALSEINEENKYRHFHNWSEESQQIICNRMIDLLDLPKDLIDISNVHEAIFDYVPKGDITDVHTILSITAYPIEGQISFY